MKVSFSDKEITNNSSYSLTEFKQFAFNIPPQILYNFDEHKFYTIIITDENSNQPYFLHMLEINNGDIIQSYVPPNPPSGNHKYTISIYQQSNLIKGSLYINIPRSGFNLSFFVIQNHLKLVDKLSFNISEEK